MNYDQVPYVSGDVHYWMGLRYKLHDPGVDGYTFVGLRIHFDETGGLTKVLCTRDFELNPQLEPGAFSPPF